MDYFSKYEKLFDGTTPTDRQDLEIPLLEAINEINLIDW